MERVMGVTPRLLVGTDSRLRARMLLAGQGAPLWLASTHSAPCPGGLPQLFNCASS